MIKEGIKRLVYNNIKEVLTIIYTNGDTKSYKISEQEYSDFLKTGKLKDII